MKISVFRSVTRATTLSSIVGLFFSSLCLAYSKTKPSLNPDCQEKALAAAIAVELVQLRGSKDPYVSTAGTDIHLRSLKGGSIAVTLWLESIRDYASGEYPYFISYKVLVDQLDNACFIKEVIVGEGHY